MSQNQENIQILIKHFTKRSEQHQKRLSADEVLRALYFLKQCDEQNLKLIGMSYERLDGGDPNEITMKNRYEGGFLVDAAVKNED